MSRVLAWHADPRADGSAFYRIFMPLEELSIGPTEVRYTHVLRRGDVDAVDVLVAQRLADVGLVGEWVRLSERPHLRTVLDMDDDLFNIPTDSPAHAAYADSATRLALKWSLEAAHHVTVSTEPLRERMLEFNDDVRVAPNCVPAWLLTTGPFYPRHDDYVPWIGWSGSSTHAGDIATITPEIERLSERLGSRARWRTMGGHEFPVSRSAAGYEHIPWLPSVRDYLKRFRVDIGIIPLADTEFNACKSDIKAREFAAKGIPVVAANHPVYRDTVIEGQTGFLYDTPEEMASAVTRLVLDPVLRWQMSQGATAHATRNFTIKGSRDAWQRAYLRS